MALQRMGIVEGYEVRGYFSRLTPSEFAITALQLLVLAVWAVLQLKCWLGVASAS